VKGGKLLRASNSGFTLKATLRLTGSLHNSLL